MGAVGLNGGEGALTAIIDNGFAYFGTQPSSANGTALGRVVRIDLSNFREAGSITLGVGEEIVFSGAIDASNHFAYFGTINRNGKGEPGKIVKVSLSDFTKVGELSLDAGEQNALAVVVDPLGFAYVATRVASGSTYAFRNCED